MIENLTTVPGSNLIRSPATYFFSCTFVALLPATYFTKSHLSPPFHLLIVLLRQVRIRWGQAAAASKTEGDVMWLRSSVLGVVNSLFVTYQRHFAVDSCYTSPSSSSLRYYKKYLIPGPWNISCPLIEEQTKRQPTWFRILNNKFLGNNWTCSATKVR